MEQHSESRLKIAPNISENLSRGRRTMLRHESRLTFAVSTQRVPRARERSPLIVVTKRWDIKTTPAIGSTNFSYALNHCNSHSFYFYLFFFHIIFTTNRVPRGAICLLKQTCQPIGFRSVRLKRIEWFGISVCLEKKNYNYSNKHKNFDRIFFSLFSAGI